MRNQKDKFEWGPLHIDEEEEEWKADKAVVLKKQKETYDHYMRLKTKNDILLANEVLRKRIDNSLWNRPTLV
jgi:dissimilatory sulfite reductase (desulfoviridin) alpha/beta subunit